jgi:riboflavin synthase alpha subunit
MDTHSVDLSMNLTELATLTTDTGKTVQAVKWDAPLGGHHVEGILSFPAIVNETVFLEEASTITLTIVNLDASERIFVWER